MKKKLWRNLIRMILLHMLNKKTTTTTHICTHANIFMHTSTYRFTNIHIHVYKCKHLCMYTCKIWSYILSYIATKTIIYTHIQEHIHSHIKFFLTAITEIYYRKLCILITKSQYLARSRSGKCVSLRQVKASFQDK